MKNPFREIGKGVGVATRPRPSYLPGPARPGAYRDPSRGRRGPALPGPLLTDRTAAATRPHRRDRDRAGEAAEWRVGRDRLDVSAHETFLPALGTAAGTIR